MTTLISVDQFREELRAKRTPTDAVFRVSIEPPVPVHDAARTLRFCFSDESVDRMGDTIRAAGWDIADFERNPVALWAHDSSAPPIGGARNVGVEGKRLAGDIEFAPPETYQFADTIYRLVLGKFIRAVSVGFLPTRHLFVQDDPDRPWGIDFLEQSLLEISVCPVPANPNALAEARRKGIDTRPLVEWAERVLDGGGAELKRVLITRDELQRLRTAAKEPSMAGKPRVPGQTRRVPVRRDDGGATEDDPTSGGAIVGNCGRAPDDQCGMTDPSECSVHGGARADTDDEGRLLRAIRRLAGRRKDGVPGEDEPPVAHEDSIRLAHKSLRTAKAYMAEGMTHHAKALSLLDGVVQALDEGPATDEQGDTDPDPDADKAAQLARAAELRAKHKPA
jgi:HK97 family phage prohead protease